MIKASEFAKRRKQLMRMTGEGSVVIVAAAPLRQRNNDTTYPFRQSSDFYYLTGFAEPNAVLVLIPERNQCVMFCRERDPANEIWNGRMAGLEGACDQYGMDDAFPIDDIDDILPNLIDGRERIYYTIGRDKEFDQQVLEWVNRVRKQVRTGARPPEEFVSLDHYLHDLRMYKSRAEVSSMGQSARIAGRGHISAMQRCKPGMMEYQIEAELLHAFAYGGAQPSYEPIVGGGANACVLHYVENNCELRDGDLLLIDAGAEYDYYASDITRTFPVNGKFSEEQKALYEVVLKAQLDAIDQVRPGKTWDDPHIAAANAITEGLVELGIIKGSVEECIESKSYRPFYMHKTGHWLGMDVHDVGDYQVDGQPRQLESGMAMTVEPGIYIAPDAAGVKERWRGIGIRIEDDVVVTRDEPKILSHRVPKTVDDIETLMAG